MIEVPVRLVPDEDDPSLAVPYVEVEIDGMPVVALLDSGAARTQLVERANLNTTRGAGDAGQSAAVFGSQRSAARSAVVCCRLGGVEVGPLEVAVVQDDYPGHRDLIGQDVLAAFRCGYRLAEGCLVLDADMPSNSHAFDLGERMHVYFDVAWAAEDSAAAAVFDTGASVTVVDRAFANRHPHLFTPAGSSSGTDASGTSVETPMALMRGPQILGEQFGDAMVAIVDLSEVNSTLQRPMELILGWTLISQADWVIDHAAARACCTLHASD